MQETIDQPLTVPEATSPLVASAERAAEWAGEPFLHPERGSRRRCWRPDTARRRALDDALAEIEAGRKEPSSEWKIRYALMLGLERVLSEKPPHLRSGTELRRHQVDALAGMLTELIAAAQRDPEPDEPDDEFEEDDEEENGENGENGDHEENGEVELEDDEELPAAKDPGAVRRYRFRHPTASGKTIAAAGFVEAARTIGVLILTHRRLLVTQFNRELTDEGYSDRFVPEITGNGNAAERATRSRSRPTPGSRATSAT